MARRLLLAFHNHQPVGNFDEVFDKAYRDCYRPLLEAIARHPVVRVALHYGGPLLEWIDARQPAYLDRLGEMARAGQVEILGGGFYEPMLSALSERDALGQLVLAQRWLERRLGVRPEGMWLAERVWEPDLARIIARAGYRFTLLDDTHFFAAGLTGTPRGWYVTDKGGSPLAIFPIAKALRYAIPFREPAEAVATIGEGVWTYGDDGEKFGVWPGTADWVWKRGWLDEFFSLVERGDAVRSERFRDVLDAEPPTGRVYLPTCSYEEMGEWTLPPEAQRRLLALRAALADQGRKADWGPFVHGATWPAFLARYPLAAALHAKMHYVSGKVARAEERAGAEAAEPARLDLYRGQCNCAYWHGLFGGLYLPFLREALWRSLLSAEALAQDLLDEPRATVETADLDADLRPEVRLRGGDWIVTVSPDAGGAAQEVSHLGRRTALVNVQERREEAYHDRVRAWAGRAAPDGGGPPRTIHDQWGPKEEGLADLLCYDRHPHLGFLDHLLPPGTTEQAFARVAWEPVLPLEDVGYRVAETHAGPEHATLTLRGQCGGLSLEKRYVVSQLGVLVSWKLVAERPVAGLFAPEVPEPVGARVELRVRGAERVWRVRIDTVSQSETGPERSAQGQVLAAPVPIDLAPGGAVEVVAELTLK